MYKMPFTKYENPSGWIEPTTFCQLKCPHCYRGADRDDFKPIHREIKDVFNELDEILRLRNIQTLSIMGGEPMLYPHLDELISYAVRKGLKVIVDTNGILINEESLKRLKRLGVLKVVIHIDQYQKREGVTNEAEANKLREKYCDLFRKVGGVGLGFNMPISRYNFKDLDILVPFFKENADIIKLCCFTILRSYFDDKPLDTNQEISEEEVFARVKEIYGLEYCAYLGKSRSDGISWLFSFNIFAGKKFLGSIDSNMAKLFQEEQYKKEKRYSFSSENNPNPIKLFFYSLINKSTRKMVFNYIFKHRLKGRLNEQLILLRNPAKFNGEQFDICESCPNAIFYQGDLVPSCLLERIKKGEDIKIE